MSRFCISSMRHRIASAFCSSHRSFLLCYDQFPSQTLSVHRRTFCLGA
ncbi:hypothetical protein OG923_15495 [Streptomyces halstedii]